MNDATDLVVSRILVIDDNEAIHQDFRKIFGANRERLTPSAAERALFGETGITDAPEFQIDSAYQGEEGLALVRLAQEQQSPYAVAFVDVRMPPGWDGIETVARIWPHDPDIQIVICTAYADYSWSEMLAKLGRSDRLVILKKPFDTIEVLQLASALTEKWRLVRQSRSIREDLEHRVAERTHELTQAGERLKASEAQYRLLFDSNPHPMWVYDLETLRFVTVNGAAVEHYGYTEQQFLAMTIHDIQPAEDVSLRVNGVDQQQGQGESFRVSRHCKRDGSIIEVEVSSEHIVFNGRPACLVLAHDITDRLAAEASLHLFAKVVESAREGIMITDASNRIVSVNPAFTDITGYTQEEVIGKSSGRLNSGLHDAEFYRNLWASVNETGRWQGEIWDRRKNGDLFCEWLSISTVKNPLGKTVYHTAIFSDITERRQQENRIERLTRIHEVLSGIDSAIVRIRDRQELFEEACRVVVEQGRFTTGWISVLEPASGRLLPVAQAGLPTDFGVEGGSFPIGLVPAGTAEVALREKRPAFDNDIERTVGGIEAESVPGTMNIQRAAIEMGAKSVIALPLIVANEMLGILALYAPEQNFFDEEEVKLLSALAGDISFGLEFIAKQDKVDYLAYYDVLTGLPNRSLFFDQLTRQLGSAQRDDLNVALVLMDLDRFRLINDTLGRQAGDALIRTVAQRIKENFRDQDSVARVGANSFAIAVSGAWQAADATRILEAHNRQVFGEPFLLGTEQMRVSAAAGVAMFPGDGDTPEVLFANAEAALREAKKQTALFLFYNPQMNARVAESLHLENRLRRALDNGEMVLWYQPKVSVRTREILGFEALMRWRDPESTLMVPPGQFIPLMEQTGLILQAGRWALFQVARDCSACCEAGIKPPRVAVNVSPIQLRQKDFTATVIEAAQKFKEAGAQFDLEITESTIMADVEAIIPILQTIRGLGVGIAVDDFGTGYSSLAYIARLPIQDLKIDRSFIVGMTQDEDSLAIVKSIIFLAHSLRLNVVAEGVETEEQAAILLELGCDEMQGYLISRPVPPEQAIKLLRNQIQLRRANLANQDSATTKKRRGGEKAKRR